MRNRTRPYSTRSPSLAQISAISPSHSATTSFMSFMASRMHRVSPFFTFEPTCTNGSAPGEGAT